MLDFIKDKTKYNSFAVIFVLFLYSLATLPGAFLSTGTVIIALALLVVAPALMRNFTSRLSVFIRAFFLLVFLIAYLNLDMMQFPRYAESTQEIILSVATIGSVGLLSGCLEYDIESMMKYGRYLALLNFVTTATFLFVSNDIFSLSMRFGYAMLPSAIWFLFEFMRNKNIIFLILFLVSTLMLVIWGSRGTLLVMMIFLGLILIKYKKISYFLILFFLYLLKDQIMSILLDVCLYLSDLTGAQKISGLIAILSGDMWGTTGGRDSLYEHCWYLFSNNPFGNGVCFWAYDSAMNNLYPHNVILQIAAESGILGLLLFFASIWGCLKRLYKVPKGYFMIYALFFSISIGRLLVSSNYWERPEFWLTMSLFLLNPYTKNIQYVEK